MPSSEPGIPSNPKPWRSALWHALPVTTLVLALFYYWFVACVPARSPTPTIESPYTTARLAFFTETEDSEGSTQESVLHVANLATGQTRPIVPVFLWHEACSPPVWSPDGKRLALGEWSGSCQGLAHLIVDLDQGDVWKISVSGWHFRARWTADSRYVVFYLYDGNFSAAAVFDATDGNEVFWPVGSRDWFVPYRWGPVAISPVSPTILLADGSLIHLPDRSVINSYNYIHSRTHIGSGAWSPDGSLLAFSVCPGSPGPQICELRLAQGDGSNVQPMATIPADGRVVWEFDGRSVIFWGRTEKYVLDIEQRRVQVLAVAEEEPRYGLVDACGDVSSILEGEDLTGAEVTAACWSPDGALLATGEQGALRVYDRGFELLHTFSIFGTIRAISWSPVP